VIASGSETIGRCPRGMTPEAGQTRASGACRGLWAGQAVQTLKVQTISKDKVMDPNGLGACPCIRPDGFPGRTCRSAPGGFV